jgi:hypothetical protein
MENQIIGKICSKCKIFKLFSEFHIRKNNNKTTKLYYRSSCKQCEFLAKKIYIENNKEKVINGRSLYYKNNKEKENNKYKIYYLSHRDERLTYSKKYFSINKEKINIKRNENRIKREKIDPSLKLKHNISSMIRYGLRRENISKNGLSCFDYLSYSFYELKTHIENLFEPWMTWENLGKYDPKTWDDNDPATWKWQLDHIIPHSNFKYQSMEEESFKKCWSLENLRPYSAKQNIKDGNRR